MVRHLIGAAITMVGTAGLTAAVTTHAGAADSGLLRVLFHGYVDGQGHSALAVIDARELSDLREVPFPHGGELSPDGRRVAFDTCHKSDRAIAVAGLESGDVQMVTPVAGETCVDVRWSRDGRKLSYTGGHDLVLHVLDLDSGANLQFQNTFLTAAFHSWSPDGTAIVYAPGRGGSRRIDIIELATSRTRTLVGPEQFGTCEVWGPDWSPVDNRIAFTACDRRLFTVNADGTGLTRVTGVTGAYAPRWSPDGHSLFFLRNGTLMRLTADGRLEALGRAPYMGGPFSVAPLN